MIEYQLTVGTRIYYTGDMANQSSFGTIMNVREETRFGPYSVDIQFDDERFEGDHRMTMGVYYLSFLPSPGRRFWLADEWNAEQNKKITEFVNKYKKGA